MGTPGGRAFTRRCGRVFPLFPHIATRLPSSLHIFGQIAGPGPRKLVGFEGQQLMPATPALETPRASDRPYRQKSLGRTRGQPPPGWPDCRGPPWLPGLAACPARSSELRSPRAHVAHPAPRPSDGQRATPCLTSPPWRPAACLARQVDARQRPWPLAVCCWRRGRNELWSAAVCGRASRRSQGERRHRPP